MSILQIPYLNVTKEQRHIARLSMILDSHEKQKIDQLSWPAYTHAPEVDFAIAYLDEHLCIKYYVKENAISATQSLPNSPVHKDSCVEFFIALDDTDYYYNLEFNCIGTCQAGYGNGKFDRINISPSLISQIEHRSCITKVSNTQKIQWELTLKIPFGIFSHHPHIENFKNKRCRVNFYKCGDDLPEPHYLAWNLIESPEPNFHLPAFFGDAHFNS